MYQQDSNRREPALDDPNHVSNGGPCVRCNNANDSRVSRERTLSCEESLPLQFCLESFEFGIQLADTEPLDVGDVKLVPSFRFVNREIATDEHFHSFCRLHREPPKV